MFDFAITHNERRRPARRLYVCIAISCCLHLVMFIVLLENPWLLEGGVYSRFKGLILLSDSSQNEFNDEDYRTVAVLKPMDMPSAEVLKGLIYDWNKARAPEIGNSVSTARWGSEDENAPDEDIRITSQTALDQVPAGKKEASDMNENRSEKAPETGIGPGSLALQQPEVQPEPKAAEETSPEKESTAENENQMALNVAPGKIPDVPPGKDVSSAPEKIKTFDNEQQAITGSGPGIFDDRGFPLDDYANLIKQMVTKNWYIPSNLRDSEAFTTIVFYIDKDGQNFGARITDSSGNNSLDITALNAILSSNPFPPLPKDFPGDHIGVKYVFIPEIR
jgi:TonB family protein